MFQILQALLGARPSIPSRPPRPHTPLASTEKRLWLAGKVGTQGGHGNGPARWAATWARQVGCWGGRANGPTGWAQSWAPRVGTRMGAKRGSRNGPVAWATAGGATRRHGRPWAHAHARCKQCATRAHFSPIRQNKKSSRKCTFFLNRVRLVVLSPYRTGRTPKPNPNRRDTAPHEPGKGKG